MARTHYNSFTGYGLILKFLDLQILVEIIGVQVHEKSTKVDVWHNIS